ncbi:MAG TPA: glycine zipper domain-containing protein [Terriglobales bacterium]|nr:glycine zipper domain-containing protein [Terriglobales bacterium]
MKFIVFVMSIFTSAFMWVQAPPSTTTSTEAWTPAKSIGMYAYPKNHQSSDQQLKDESQCYGSAKQQTGVDPQTSAPAGQSPADQKAAQQAGQSTPKGGAVKGGAGGAAGGAAIGAIAGDAGTGAAVGATAGAVAGRRQQKKAEKEAKNQAAQQTTEAQQQAQAQATAQHQAALDSFKRAFSACMDARGYSVQ